jgi:outer membrane lipoprotein-sorting protein
MEKNKYILSRTHGLTGRGWLSILTIAVLVWISMLPVANAEPIETGLSLDRILSNVKHTEEQLKTFSASFKQSQKNHLLVAPLVSQGLMFYHHTGKLLMKISLPEPFVLLLRDRLMIMGDPVTKTFKQKTFPGRKALLKRYLGTGQPVEVLKKTYDIRLVNDGRGEDCQLDLIPKKRNRKMPFQSIRVTIDKMLWLPIGIRLEEPNMDYTELELSYLTINDPLPENIFTIDMPPIEIDDPFEPDK